MSYNTPLKERPPQTRAVAFSVRGMTHGFGAEAQIVGRMAGQSLQHMLSGNFTIHEINKNYIGVQVRSLLVKHTYVTLEFLEQEIPCRNGGVREFMDRNSSEFRRSILQMKDGRSIYMLNSRFAVFIDWLNAYRHWSYEKFVR